MKTVIGVVALALVIGIVVVAAVHPVVQTTFTNGAPTYIAQPDAPLPESPELLKISTRCGSLVRPESGVYPVEFFADEACAARRRQSMWLVSWLGLALSVVVLASLLLPRRTPGELSMPR